jgi:hypothetical protein
MKTKLLNVLTIIATILILGGCSNSTNAKSEARSVSAVYSTSGSAYIPLAQSNTITINDSVQKAAITPDRSTIVVLLDDGTLYYTDSKQSEKNVVMENVVSFSLNDNNGFVFADENANYYRVLFSDNSVTALESCAGYTTSDNNQSILYYSDKGEVFTISQSESTSNRVSYFDANTSIRVSTVSDDGGLAVYVVSDNGNNTIYLNENDEKIKLGEFTSDYASISSEFTNDQNMVVISSTYSDQLYIKKSTEDVITVKLPNQRGLGSTIYTENGLLSNQKTGSFKNIYFSVESDNNGYNLYTSNLSGDKERVLSNINSYDTFYIGNGKIIYLDDDSNLYIGAIDGAVVSDKNRIASDVNTINVSSSGKYLYYMKNCTDDIGDLYCLKLDDSKAESQHISSDVACLTLSYLGWTYDLLNIGVGGDYVYYMKDVAYIKDTSSKYGELYIWNYKDSTSTKIGSDVVMYSPDSGLDKGLIDKSAFIYQKYSSVDGDNIIVDLMFYNGKTSDKIASDIIHE